MNLQFILNSKDVIINMNSGSTYYPKISKKLSSKEIIKCARLILIVLINTLIDICIK